MKQYLIDTNICSYFLQGRYNLHRKFEEVGMQNCFISEITLAELKFGVENSKYKEKNRTTLATFANQLGIIPIFDALDFYAVEKARLRKAGQIIEDFDLLIGATAVHHSLVMVSRNVKHLARIAGIQLENWVDEGS